MTGVDCYYDTAGCLVCPAIPASPARPARVQTDPNLGWNAGANSLAMLDGDVRVAFALDALPTGIYVGLKGARRGVTAPELIPHAFYLYSAAGRGFVEVRERGLMRDSPKTYTLGDLLEIRREAGRVSYWLASALLYQSDARSTGPVLVNTCLYSAGDTIP